MTAVYPGDRVALPDRYGRARGVFTHLVASPDGVRALVTLEGGQAQITLPLEDLTYAGPPIPPEPEVGAMVLIDGVPYRRGEDGWRHMCRPSIAAKEDLLARLPLLAVLPDLPWGELIRRHRHARPQRLVTVELKPEGAGG